MTGNRDDRYALHRAALAPVLAGAPPGALRLSCNQFEQAGETEFVHLLLQQGLGPLWDDLIDDIAIDSPFSASSKVLLRQSRLQATAQYLIQRHSLGLARAILDDICIPHVIIKGCHTRELYFDTPALRPALDIDILVRPGDRLEAIRAFQAGGFSFHGLTETISHECSLVKGNTWIDLHWDILRPGRTREPMVDALLNSRVDYGSHWGLGHGETLFLMLAHPVFTKYSTTPHARLMRLVDLAQLLHRYPGSVDDAVPLLRAAGLATAGWITSTWLELLSPGSGAGPLAHSLAPGRLRRSYLRQWLTHNLSSRLLGKPLLIQLGFTLLAHDTLRDAARAALHVWRSGQAAGTTLEATQRQVLSPP